MKPKLLLCLALVLSANLVFAVSVSIHVLPSPTPDWNVPVSVQVADADFGKHLTVFLKGYGIDSEEFLHAQLEVSSEDDQIVSCPLEKKWTTNGVQFEFTVSAANVQASKLRVSELAHIGKQPMPSFTAYWFYLPRQDESDHGTIKDYEFYVNNNGKNFGQPVSKGAFEPGKEEKMETFEPVECRFIKLKAISEIHGLPWTSAAEIGVIQRGETPAAKDYWRGNTGYIPSQIDSSKPNAIDSFVAALSANGGLWLNGLDAMDKLQATSPEEVVSETLRTAKFESGMMTSYHILDMRTVHIGSLPGTYTAAFAHTNLGQMIVLMQYIEGKDSTPGHWWRRIYSADPPYNRLY